jgi:hypothetical protein
MGGAICTQNEDGMPVTTRWDNPEKTVIRMDFVGKWTWDEFYAANDQLMHLFASVPHTVDILIDNTRNEVLLPEGTMARARKVFGDAPPNRGFMIIARVNALVRMFFPLYQKIYGAQTGMPEIIFVATLDEARTYIHQRRHPTP